ncbi:MAG: carbamoyl-phosphate synthase large subunit [Alphaproteobacteria bacterium]|nr:carbamoyl-phosphate synthase large subunit [Alphaproteobacteria bacterium]
MPRKLLIANRGEIAIRVARTAAEMGIATVAVFSEDDAASLHVRKADFMHALPGSGAAAYLNIAAVVAAARESGCDAIHPGYGFLSENADFAHACEREGICFVGPSPQTLTLFGDKAKARALAEKCGVSLLKGTGPIDAKGAADFLASLGKGGAIMLKAVAGGGGRGMRRVADASEVEAAFARCASEAKAAFGNDAVYAEEYLPRARHIEVQIVGDGKGVSHIWDRECSLQRQRQKVIEIAPAPGLSPALREKLFEAAVNLARAADYRSLGTIEFLVSGDRFAFIEANARLQVEHTVTEEVTGLDLVRIQLEVADGKSLAELHLTQKDIPHPRDAALQARINMETMAADGTAKPAGGTLAVYEPPSGRGVRVDGFGYAGYKTSARYDSLLAKLIVRAPTLAEAKSKAYRALCEFRIAGAPTNIAFLQNLLLHPAGHEEIHTGFVEENIEALIAQREADHAKLYFDAGGKTQRAGSKVDASDPLAVLALGKQEKNETSKAAAEDAPDGTVPLVAPLQGTIVSLSVKAGDAVRAGEPVLVMEAMKMEHVIAAEVSGTLRGFAIEPGETVFEGATLAFLEEGDVAGASTAQEAAADLDAIRPDLEEFYKRREFTLDRARPDAVEKRRKTNQRTARENIEDLCDADSFVEYGSLVVAGRLRRNSMDELIRKTPGDGLVMGLGRVNGHLFPDEQARIVAMSYDYTVLAGTQGLRNHEKKDRMLHIATDWRLPIVFFTEGGGGRPGDTDAMSAGGLNTTTFQMFAKLSGLVPLVGINSGYCFAGNAALLGCCDVIIATKNSSIGMGGPAMIEGGGLGVFHPSEVGPVSVQSPNGVIDIVVEDEAEGVATAKKYLSYFQGAVKDWSCIDQRELRRVIPENRLRVYDIRKVIEMMSDTGSVLELRREFGVGMVTAFARIEGRPVGIIANNPKHLGGAIDRDGSDKAARFMQLCDAYDIPILMLCDTPGNMVGPEAEKTGLVRHNSRLFVIGANVSVPLFTVILRKGYGLGAQGMAGASFVAPFFTISWPTGEFGGMGLEGAVKLGYRNELAAIADPAERKRKFDEMVAQMYARGKAISAATLMEFDEVIDPADTRKWITAGLRSVPAPPKREGKKRPWIDAW